MEAFSHRHRGCSSRGVNLLIKKMGTIFIPIFIEHDQYCIYIICLEILLSIFCFVWKYCKVSLFCFMEIMLSKFDTVNILGNIF